MQMPTCANKYLKTCLSFTSLPAHGHVIGEWAARTVRSTFGNRSAFGLQVGSCKSKEAVTSKELFVGVGFGFWVARLFWYWKGNIVKESDMCVRIALGSININSNIIGERERERSWGIDYDTNKEIDREIMFTRTVAMKFASRVGSVQLSNYPTAKEMFASRVGFMSLQK